MYEEAKKRIEKIVENQELPEVFRKSLRALEKSFEELFLLALARPEADSSKAQKLQSLDTPSTRVTSIAPSDLRPPDRFDLLIAETPILSTTVQLKCNSETSAHLSPTRPLSPSSILPSYLNEDDYFDASNLLPDYCDSPVAIEPDPSLPVESEVRMSC